ncbi:MAG: DUF167 domain-containing protein [Gordonia sp. (in: high G+C Gram-positive bacteria)]|uniref:DUF167 domain-containing protein n=1 Tax=Gordonia sp. (in: high G+C Gram-positive bacteria) TaxID=84139 RepID=UPI0039E694F3
MEVPDRVAVQVKPNSKKGPLIETADDGAMTVYVREPATEGKANKAVALLLARHFGVPKSSVVLVGGATSRLKRFTIG